MPPLTTIRPSPDGRRGRLLARTALCGVLCGLGAPALAAPVGGSAEVNAGGGMPVITTDGLATSIGLNAPRTVLSWTSFNVKTDETVTFNFGARNWIVLNRIVGLSESKIQGAIEGKVGSAFGGNVWFASQNSVIFGAGSRVDVGGLLVGIGSIGTAGFLDPANNTFSFQGGDTVASAKLYLLTGSRVTAHGGSAIFAGPSLVTRANAVVTASQGSVLYGSAKTFQIRLAPGAGGDFDLVDFVVSSAADGTESNVAMDLAGNTQANAVFLAAVNRSTLGSAVINLEGLITATAATADGGDIVLSGGGGIANRQAAATLSGAGTTDVFLNRATASRDLLISNVGQIHARPWVRPASEAVNPTTIEQDEDCSQRACEPSGNGNGNGFGNGNGNGGFAPLETVVLDKALVSSLFDPTAISAVNAGRDARIAATASIELGRVVTGRDLDVTGPDIKANSLTAAGALNVAANQGDVLLANVSVMRDGVISAKGDVKIDAITATQKLAVTAGRDILVGDGVSTATGGVTLSAAQNVVLDLGAAKIDAVTAGSSVTLRGGAIEVATVTTPRFLARSASVKVGTVTTSGDVYVVATDGDAVVGDATAGDDVFVLATHGTASLGNATLTGAGADAVGADFTGNPDVAGNGRVVRVQSSDLDAVLGLATGGVTGATSVTVDAGRDAIVEVTKDTPQAFSAVAARDATLRAPTVRLDAVTSGRDLTIGSTVGDFVLTTTLSAVRNITVNAAGALRVGDVRADAGSVTLIGSTVQAGVVTASEDVTLRTTAGGFTATSPLSAGRNVTIDVAGKATLGQTTGAAGVRIAAGDLDLTATVTAPTVQIESRNGALRVGGPAGTSGFVLDSNEFGQLRASGQLKIYAGLTTPGATARGDLTLQDLAIDTASTPNVTFLVGPSANALVTGTTAPTTSGGILRVGDATDFNWRPNSILITGALGAATFANGDYTGVRAFDQVRLAARQDILMGSQRFIGLIQATEPEDIDLARLRPAGVAPQGPEISKVYVTTGQLEVSADNKVVQQNAAQSGSLQSVGLLFTGQFRPAVIIDPPRVVELWGAFTGQNGQVLSGAQANGALTFAIVDAAGNPISQPAGANYRFNSCDFGTTNCAVLSGDGFGGDNGGLGSGSADSALRARDALGDDADLSEEALIAALSSESLTDPPVLLGVAPPENEDVITDPVTTGTGSEEIWRKRRQKK
ncbi:filamentous hemagglutinin N-terminal domain-containing protein [Phenylobacterium sp.]|uniref:two-partner secretion domain-containing protein n=1 Tax=Phenylobacterium sp. TaxID=1871053 RepID=UPI002ED9A388